MKIRRPRSLNGLILVGFGLVVLPLLLAVIWALVNLDRVAAQSERLVVTGVSAAESNRLLEERLGSLERLALQYQVLRNPDTLLIMREDLAALQAQLVKMAPLVEEARATELAVVIGNGAAGIVSALSEPEIDDERLAAAIRRFGPLERQVKQLTGILSSYVETELSRLQETARDAQRASTWQVALLVPGTIALVLIFTLLVARPISQIDRAIHQLGQSGFSKPIRIKGPTDLEQLHAGVAAHAIDAGGKRSDETEPPEG